MHMIANYLYRRMINSVLFKFNLCLLFFKDMSKDQILRCKWNDIIPTESQLSSMPLLKELVNLTPFSITYRKISQVHELLLPISDPESASFTPDDRGNDNDIDNENDNDNPDEATPPSVSLGPTVTILFQMPSIADFNCKIFWVGYNGEKVVYNELTGASSEYEQATYAGYFFCSHSRH